MCAAFHKISHIIVISVNSGESDAKIINDTTQIIAPMSDTACVFVELIDDEIAESFEIFILNVTANNILDVANGTTTIEVSDNDGIINCMIMLKMGIIIKLKLFEGRLISSVINS